MTATVDSASPVLEVRNLSVDFQLRQAVVHAVRDVSFSLGRGETLCLVGESGSGKSVTARAILNGIDAPGRITAGKVLLHGKDGTTDITALRPNGPQLRGIRGGRIGLIFQEPMSALSPFHTIGDQIDEVIQIHLHLEKAEARRRTIELLRQVEIADPERMARRYSFEYSGGMRQRVCIAMALACNPDVLIADEPTTALDVTTQAEILDLIKRLQREPGMAVLLITHDMGVVAEVGDRVAVMRHGRIVEQGSLRQIFKAPEHPYTRHLLATAQRLEHKAAARIAEAPAAAPGPVRSVRGLSKVYGQQAGVFGRNASAGFRAVDDVSLDLHAGENLGIVGESGSGKTTLGRLIMRLIEPTSGTIAYNGGDGRLQDVLALRGADLKRYHAQVRLVFQDPFASLNPRMTAGQIIADPLRINRIGTRRDRTERVAELMRLVGLSPDTMGRYPHAFSGGQRQRIGIARALALEPRVIVADEATSALDVSIRAQILDLLLDLQARLGLSFIFIAHDIAVVRYFCDRVAVMHRGKIVEVGEAEAICTAPDHPYTRALVSAVPSPDPDHKRMLNRVRYVA